MSTNFEQVGRFVAKRMLSLENMEVLRSIAITLSDEGDDKGSRVAERLLEQQWGLRVLLGLPLEPKYGGMDRQGV